MGGAQATVSWSTDGLFSVMFPTAPGEAGRGRREGGEITEINVAFTVKSDKGCKAIQ